MLKLGVALHAMMSQHKCIKLYMKCILTGWLNSMADCKTPEAKQIQPRQCSHGYTGSSNYALPIHTTICSVSDAVEAMCHVQLQDIFSMQRVWHMSWQAKVLDWGCYGDKQAQHLAH